MSDPFVAEIRIFGFNFAPRGWAMCNGQLLSISQNTALFSLLGTTYGGDGKSTFALPNLQGAAPIDAGQGSGLSRYDLGQSGGEPAVTLLTSEIPAHQHTVSAVASGGDQSSPQNAAWAQAGTGRQGANIYTQSTASDVALSPQAFAPAGGDQPHNNMPPYLTLNFCIALQGIYPPRS
jgi:microcystin-dependent protein